jgi:hypothetical protein
MFLRSLPYNRRDARATSGPHRADHQQTDALALNLNEDERQARIASIAGSDKRHQFGR